MLAPSLISGSVFVTLRLYVVRYHLYSWVNRLLFIQEKRTCRKNVTLRSKGPRLIPYLFSFTKKKLFFCLLYPSPLSIFQVHLASEFFFKRKMFGLLNYKKLPNYTKGNIDRSFIYKRGKIQSFAIILQTMTNRTFPVCKY